MFDFLDLAEQLPVPGEPLSDALGYVRRIREAAARQYALVQGIITYLSVSRVDLPLESVDLKKTVDAAVADLCSDITRRSAEVTSGDLQWTLRAHPASLRLVVTHLLSNALKFVPLKIKPRVNITAERLQSPLSMQLPVPRVRLIVAGNGVGIPEEALRAPF